MSKLKVAIACQGGGSQTAFTAGVLKSFFEREVQKDWTITSFSGTSGGAVCSILAWYGMLRAAQGDKTPISNRLAEFWSELSAQHPEELTLENWTSSYLRMVERGMFPHFEMSPAGLFCQTMFAILQSFLPRHVFTDLRAMLEKHIDFKELPQLIREDSPLLVVGAADVLSGEMKKFYSQHGEICVEAILASAAVPNLFPAVQIGDKFYWDGLFSDNPPIQELLRPRFVGPEHVPDEVWVIQINPSHTKTVPTTPAQIVDRRNQMIGNVSFQHSLQLAEMINMILSVGGFTDEVWETVMKMPKRGPIKIRIIQMSDELMESLDYVSKLSRAPEHIARLLQEGEQQGAKFLDGLANSAA